MNGTTLRDLFAAHALQGLLANNEPINMACPDVFATVAAGAYRYADAMLAARSGRRRTPSQPVAGVAKVISPDAPILDVIADAGGGYSRLFSFLTRVEEGNVAVAPRKVTTLRDFATLTEHEALSYKGIGPFTVSKIGDLLNYAGLNWRPPPTLAELVAKGGPS